MIVDVPLKIRFEAIHIIHVVYLVFFSVWLFSKNICISNAFVILFITQYSCIFGAQMLFSTNTFFSNNNI